MKIFVPSRNWFNWRVPLEKEFPGFLVFVFLDNEWLNFSLLLEPFPFCASLF